MIKLNKIIVLVNEAQANEQTILNNLNVDFKKESFTIIVGANGSGKSTLLNTIAGNIFCKKGSIIIDGEDVTNLPDYKRSKWIARVFQNPLQGTAPNLTILENCRLAALRTQKKLLKIGLKKNFEHHIKEQLSTLDMGLENKLNTLVGNLSGGQRQALTLIMSVLDNCKILLLDEPTAALDPKTANAIMQLTNRIVLQHKLTAIMVTHNLKDANAFGNRIIQLQQGEIIKDYEGIAKEQLSSDAIFNWF
jgi:putative tryptophan/tyrosine transport system ATP-binding protein